MRAALRLARRTSSTEREADVLATLGLALAYARRTAAGLAAFDQALHLSSGVLAGRVLYRRAVALWRLGGMPRLSMTSAARPTCCSGQTTQFGCLVL